MKHGALQQKQAPPSPRGSLGERTFGDAPRPQLSRCSREANFNGEKVLLFRSIRSDIPLIFAFVTVVSLAVMALIGPTVARGEELAGGSLVFIASLLVICGCSVSGLLFYRRYNVRYLIAPDGVMALRGILSNHQIDAKLQYYQIRGTEIHRSLFERLIGTGDLHIRGATSSDTEVLFRGVRDPYRYQNVIQERHRVQTGQAMESSRD